MPVVLGPDAKGKLTLNDNSSKCLNSNLVMPIVFEPDAKGKLTLSGIFQVFKLKLSHVCSPRTRC